MLKTILLEVLQFILAVAASMLAVMLSKAMLTGGEFTTPTWRYFIVGNIAGFAGAAGVSSLFPNTRLIGVSLAMLLFYSIQLYGYFFMAPEYWMYGAVLLVLPLLGIVGHFRKT